MTSTLMKLSIFFPTGARQEFISEGFAEQIGRITSSSYHGIDGQAHAVPSAGHITEICRSYSSAGATGAELILGNNGLVYRDAKGGGEVTDRPSSGELEVLRTADKMSEIARLYGIASGRTLYNIVGQLIRSTDVAPIVGSCNSLIQLIINTPLFTGLELLQARVPPNNGPGVVQRYSMGGDIVHLFTHGSAEVNFTKDQKFRQIIVQLNEREKWAAVVTPQNEYYQVINTSETLSLEYFWFFLEHEDAYNRGGLSSLTLEESVARGWRFKFANAF